MALEEAIRGLGMLTTAPDENLIPDVNEIVSALRRGFRGRRITPMCSTENKSVSGEIRPKALVD